MTEAQAKRKKARRKGMPRSYERQRGIAERKEGFLLVSLALSLFVGVTLFFDQPCLDLRLHVLLQECKYGHCVKWSNWGGSFRGAPTFQGVARSDLLCWAGAGGVGRVAGCC